MLGGNGRCLVAVAITLGSGIWLIFSLHSDLNELGSL